MKIFIFILTHTKQIAKKITYKCVCVCLFFSGVFNIYPFHIIFSSMKSYMKIVTISLFEKRFKRQVCRSITPALWPMMALALYADFAGLFFSFTIEKWLVRKIQFKLEGRKGVDTRKNRRSGSVVIIFSVQIPGMFSRSWDVFINQNRFLSITNTIPKRKF